jgi:phosphoribosylformylglycinamidine synthase
VEDISSSQYLINYNNVRFSPAPHFDLDEEFDIQKAVAAIIKTDLVNSAHDISEGGLFVAMLESGMISGLGFSITTDQNIRKDAFLFGEAQSRVIVSVDSSKASDLESELKKQKVAYNCIGKVLNNDLIVDNQNFGSIAEYCDIYDNTLEVLINRS